MAGRRPSETSALLIEHGIDDLRNSTAQHERRRYGATTDDAAVPSLESPELETTDDNDAAAAAAAPELESPELETTWWAETALLARHSAPLVVTYILQYSFSLVTVFVASRLGTKELGAAALATIMANITGLCIYEGLATSLDMLTSRAFSNGKKHLVGLHVQRMSLLVCVVTLPLGALWICSPWILAALVRERDAAMLAGGFMRIYLLGAPGWGIFEAGKRFCQAQGDYTASLVVVLVCLPLNLLWNWLLVFGFNLGLAGAAWAVVISNTLQPIVLVMYVALWAPSHLQCWPGLDFRRASQNWGPMVKLAIPGVIMTISEWLAFDVFTLFVCHITGGDLAAKSVFMTMAVCVYHIAFPISIAASTRFGDLIGHGALHAARVAWRTYYLIFVGVGLFDATLLMSCRYAIAHYFTDDGMVEALILAAITLMSFAQFLDALVALSNALLRGLGRPEIGACVSLGVYCLLALPLSSYLIFGPPRLDLGGLAIGPFLGLACAPVIMATYMRYTDWQKAVDDARAREE